MSEPIKPLDLDLNDLDRFGDLSEDELYAPADVSEIPSAALSLAVPSLTNSPGCTPSAAPRPPTVVTVVFVSPAKLALILSRWSLSRPSALSGWPA